MLDEIRLRVRTVGEQVSELRGHLRPRPHDR